jgi:polyphosphate kinase 2
MPPARRSARSPAPATEPISSRQYESELRELQIQLVRFQSDLIARGRKVVIVLEGRDAAGKDGTIKRFIEHLSPRETRVVALAKPSDRERSSWYFQRYVGHLPAAGEMVLFNRSWYNRAGVERVMKFCTPAEYEEFMDEAPQFEQMLLRSDIRLFKYYLDIGRDEQRRRLRSRAADPLKQWKLSSLDAYAQKYWKQYSAARDAMLLRTHTPLAPWRVVLADDKRRARLNIIRDFLSSMDYDGKDAARVLPDRSVVRSFEPELIERRVIAL